MSDIAPHRAPQAVGHQRTGSASDVELDKLWSYWQAAEQEERRAYAELCDAEDDFERTLDAVHKVMMEQSAHAWDLACHQRNKARRAYNTTFDPVGWQRIRDCIDLREQNNLPVPQGEEQT